MLHGIVFFVASLIVSSALYFLSLPVSEGTGPAAFITAAIGAGVLLLAFIIGNLIVR